MGTSQLKSFLVGLAFGWKYFNWKTFSLATTSTLSFLSFNRPGELIVPSTAFFLLEDDCFGSIPLVESSSPSDYPAGTVARSLAVLFHYLRFGIYRLDLLSKESFLLRLLLGLSRTGTKEINNYSCCDRQGSLPTISREGVDIEYIGVFH